MGVATQAKKVEVETMVVIAAIGHALELAGFMLWELFWPLALGFLLSAMVQTVVSKRAIAGALGHDTPRGVALACAFGAASSSCSYAAVAIARALYRRGATFANAILFEFASTNLVFELGLVLLILLGWQFLVGELLGGLLMIVLLALLFRLTLRQRMLDEARLQADRGIAGRMEGHGSMDMSVTEGPFFRRLFTGRAFTAISHSFSMDIASLYQDLALGFLIAGALGAWVPTHFWQLFFLTGHPRIAEFWDPLIGPFISMISFVCSVGNVPLAAILWNGGISFGGVISFIFADLIIIPILDIYRRYYGAAMSRYLLMVSYTAMAVAGFLIAQLFRLLGLLPTHHRVVVLETAPTWNITSYLDLLFLLVMALLGWRFLRTGGPAMLRGMSQPPATETVADPVCGMSVDPSTATERSAYRGRTYFFCSADCRRAFERDPERYARPASDGQSDAPAHDHHS